MLPLPRGGLEVVFFPAPSACTCGGASHGGRLYRENLRGHLLLPHASTAGSKVAERARRLLLAARCGCAASSFAASAAATYRDGAAWLASGDAATLVERSTVVLLYLRLAFATGAACWLRAGSLARALGVRSVVGDARLVAGRSSSARSP